MLKGLSFVAVTSGKSDDTDLTDVTVDIDNHQSMEGKASLERMTLEQSLLFVYYDLKMQKNRNCNDSDYNENAAKLKNAGIEIAKENENDRTKVLSTDVVTLNSELAVNLEDDNCTKVTITDDKDSEVVVEVEIKASAKNRATEDGDSASEIKADLNESAKEGGTEDIDYEPSPDVENEISAKIENTEDEDSASAFEVDDYNSAKEGVTGKDDVDSDCCETEVDVDIDNDSEDSEIEENNTASQR